jgi:hypothetical protein
MPSGTALLAAGLMAGKDRKNVSAYQRFSGSGEYGSNPTLAAG